MKENQSKVMNVCDYCLGQLKDLWVHSCKQCVRTNIVR